MCWLSYCDFCTDELNILITLRLLTVAEIWAYWLHNCYWLYWWVECIDLEQEFENKSDMQNHSKELHRTEEKTHKCIHCLKSFPTSQQLGQHSLVHSNLRKYPCAYCDKAFKQLSHVQQHQRIHTGRQTHSLTHSYTCTHTPTHTYI